MFKIYKGVQKPLLFKSLKGRYIYIGGGVFIGGMIITIILTNVIGFVIGAGLGAIIIGGGLYLVFKKQEKGLYSKTKKKGVFLIKNEIQFKPK